MKPGSLITLVAEKDFMESVVELARLMGWKSYHTFNSRRSEAGFPDLCMTRGGRVIFAELKTDKGKVSPAQREWLDALALCPGLEVLVWRPSDWDDVEYTLRRRP